jgi:hypothetical protein
MQESRVVVYTPELVSQQINTSPFSKKKVTKNSYELQTFEHYDSIPYHSIPYRIDVSDRYSISLTPRADASRTFRRQNNSNNNDDDIYIESRGPFDLT